MADPALPHSKPCSKCGETKPLSEFHKQKNGPFGFRCACKGCLNDHYTLNKDAHRVRTAKYRRENVEKERQRHKKYAKENAELLRASAARWRARHPERVREINRRHDEKHRSTPRGRLDNAVSTNVHRWLKKGAKAGRKWEDLVGYSANELMRHLERQFQPGMTWENYGKKWHIDHEVPLSAHNYHSPEHEDFRRAWALTNLRPMWAFDNMSKKDKVLRPFQPSLAM